MRVEELI